MHTNVKKALRRSAILNVATFCNTITAVEYTGTAAKQTIRVEYTLIAINQVGLVIAADFACSKGKSTAYYDEHKCRRQEIRRKSLQKKFAEYLQIGIAYLQQELGTNFAC